MASFQIETLLINSPAFPLGYDHGLDFSGDSDFPFDHTMTGDPLCHNAHQHIDRVPAVEFTPVKDHYTLVEVPTRTPSLSPASVDFSEASYTSATDVRASHMRSAPPGPPTSSASGHGPHRQARTPGAEEREMFDGSSESPEQKVLTPNSSHPGNVSYNEGSTTNLDDDVYSSQSGFSPMSSSNTDSHDLVWPRDAPATANTVAAGRMSNHVFRLPTPSGADPAPSHAQPSLATPRPTIDHYSEADNLMSTTWMASQDDGAAYALLNNTSNEDAAGPDAQYASSDQFNTYVSSAVGSNDVSAPHQQAFLSFRGPHNYAPQLYHVQSNFQTQQQPAQYLPHQYNPYYTAAQQQCLQTLPFTTPQECRTDDVQMPGASFQPCPGLLMQQQIAANWQGAPPQFVQSQQHYGATSAPMSNTHHHLLPDPSMQQQPVASPRTTRPLIAQSGMTARAADPVNRAHLTAVNKGNLHRVSRVQQPHGIKFAKDESSSPKSSHSALSNRATRTYPQIVKAEPGTRGRDNLKEPPKRTRPGGRKKALSPVAKERISAMRRGGACWRCVFQRDPCDGSAPCTRCLARARSQRPGTHFFECSRVKLPELVHEFLPVTMTLMHKRQTIEDTVHHEVMEWNYNNAIDVLLHTGYGPPLQWTVYEFQPRTPELLGQLQYFHDPVTGASQARLKYSPPFGLLRLDDNDDAHVNAYLDALMDKRYLEDFGWYCFPEESQLDNSAFQCNLLCYMCRLYASTGEDALRNHLHLIIRMMIITYIMAHTLTLSEETIQDVISHVTFSPQPNQITRHTSPRLANRQLKFFFAMLRAKVYSDILHWQQQTFHHSKKEETWLASFCAVLGFAMVLEEVQQMLHLQADAKVYKGEMSHDLAIAEACNACKRIDDRFKLLVDLFQCKYRDKKWGVGSFGPGTPRYDSFAEHQFLTELRELVEEKVGFLRSRRIVECRPENSSQYTGRLVARFLLPFLDLPA